MINLNFSPFPILFTDRLQLRKITKNDANNLFALRSDKKIMQFIDRPMAVTIKDAHEYIDKIEESLRNKYGITWAIVLKDGKGLIGTIGLWRIIQENFRAEIGYMLHTDCQGMGLMQEAMVKVLDYGFNTLKLHSVEAVIKPGNDSSSKLLERNRFIREGYFKENYYFNGKFLDSIIYSLLTQNFNHKAIQ